MNTQLDLSPDVAVPAVVRPLKARIDTNSVTLDIAGNARSHWTVRLPTWFTTEDIAIPELWANVQARRDRSFRTCDTVFLISETWAADTVVTACDGGSATLGSIKLISLATRTKGLFSDGVYRVAWTPSGYIVERISDGQAMSAPTPTEASAERDLRQLYPQKAS